MKNRIFGLSDIIKLADNEELSEKYVKYLCGLDEDRQYKHREITDIRALTEALPETADFSGFIFGYVVP